MVQNIFLYKFFPLTKLTPWSRVLPANPLDTKSRDYPPFMEPEGSLLCLQEFAAGPYSKPDESSPHYPTI